MFLKIFEFCFCWSSASITGVSPLVVIKGNIILEWSGQVLYTDIAEAIDLLLLRKIRD